jgi:quinol monooxygenase YgiN
MELFIFARFHALEGCEDEIEVELPAQIKATRAEPGCLNIHAFRSTRDRRLFYIHSCFVDEEAFELHAALPHTTSFIEKMERLIDHPLDVKRTTLVE